MRDFMSKNSERQTEKIFYQDNIPTLDENGRVIPLDFILDKEFNAIEIWGDFYGYYVFKEPITKEEIMRRLLLRICKKPLYIKYKYKLFIPTELGSCVE